MCLAVPGKIVRIGDEEDGLRYGTADFGGVRKKVCLAFFPDAAVGEFVLVHAGFAISKIYEEEAKRVFADLERMRGEGQK